MLTKERIERFYIDLQALGLKRPVADISKATGYSKGNVSEWISRKKEPSENFINKFYDAFYKSFNALEIGNEAKQHSANPLPGHATLQDLLNEKDRLIKMAEDHYNDMKTVVEKNLNIIIASLGHNGGILEQVKALVDVNIKQIARQDQALLKASKAAQAQVRGSKRGKAGDGQKAHNL